MKLPVRRRRHAGAGLALSALAAAASLGSVLLQGSTASASSSSHTFVMLMEAFPPSIDTAEQSGFQTTELMPTLASTLVMLSPIASSGAFPGPLDVQPELATSWKETPRGWVFDLRHGVHGPTGDLFTSADVVYSMDRAAAINSSAKFLMEVGNISLTDPATALGPYTVRINQTAPSTLDLNNLALSFMGIYDAKLMQEHATSSDPWSKGWAADNTAFFGPYELDNFQPTSTSATITLNRHYYGKRPYFTTIKLEVVPDDASRAELVESGEANIARALSYSQVASARHDSTVKTLVAPSAEQDVLYLNLRDSTYRSRYVREAIADAVNRPRIVQTVYNGLGEPSKYIWPQGLPTAGHPPAFSYDPTKAKALLKKAGVKNLSMTIAYSPDAVGGETYIALEVANQLEAIGVKVQLEAVPSAVTFEAGIYHPGGTTYSAWIFGATPLVPDQRYDLYLNADSKGLLNTLGFSDPAFDSTLSTALTTKTGATQTTALERAELIGQELVPYVPLVDADQTALLSPNITGLTTQANKYLYLWQARG